MAGSALIVGAAPRQGSETFYAEVLAASPVVVAADAGAEWCVELGRVPDRAVGDFDSARPGAVERLAALGVPTDVYPAEKDASDLDLCVAVARDIGCGSVDFTAAFSARLDHTLAGLGTLLEAADLAPRILEPDMTCWLLDPLTRPSVSLDLSAGTVFSLLAPTGAAGVTVKGSRYMLGSDSLGVLSSRGLSNVANGGSLSVEVGQGRLLLMVQGAVPVVEQAHE